MGVSLFPRFREEIPGLDPLQMIGKVLAQEMERLDPPARAAGATPLGDFVSVSKTEMEDLAMEEPPDDADFSEPGPEEYDWFPPEDGLKTVASLAQHVRDSDPEGRTKADLLEDLEFLRQVLAKAAEAGVPFNLAIDF